jgi:hypothetical protein
MTDDQFTSLKQAAAFLQPTSRILAAAVSTSSRLLEQLQQVTNNNAVVINPNNQPLNYEPLRQLIVRNSCIY